MARGWAPPSIRMTRTVDGSMWRKSLGQAAGGQFADLAGQLHARGPRSDDGEGHEEALLRGVGSRLGDLEGAVHAATELHGVVDRLHPRSDQRVLVVSEVRLPGSGGDDQAVVGIVERLTRKGGGVHHPRLEVESGDPGQGNLHVLVAAQQVPQHRRDLTGGEDAGRHLVEERLEQVMVALVDEGDVDVGPRQHAGGGKATESATDDDDTVARVLTHGSSFPGDGTPWARLGLRARHQLFRTARGVTDAGGGATPHGVAGPARRTARPWRGRTPR